MFKKSGILLFIFLPQLIVAQVFSNGGRFSVDFNLGCTPLEVNITELDSFGPGAPRLYFYGDGSAETTSLNYTYPSAGTFQILQIIGVGASTVRDSVIVTVTDPTETQFSIEKCGANGISITSAESTYDFIRIYFTPTDSVTLMEGETASFNFSSNTQQTFQSKGFYSGGRENCTTFNHDFDPLPSLSAPSITSSSIVETCLDHFVLSLELSDFDPLVNYQIELSQTNTNIVFDGKISNSSIVLEGINYDRNASEYCLRIITLDNCLSTQIEGDQVCEPITELSSTPFSNLYSSYEDNGIFINLESVSTGELLIFRKLGIDGEFEQRASVMGSHTDPIGSLARQYFYRIDYQDSCNQILFSVETNPPILASNRIDENTYDIDYTEPINALGTVSEITYTVGNEQTDIQPITASNFNIALDPANGTRQFLQTAVTYTSGQTLSSNTHTYKYTPIIHVPTAFTPNGDGLNDTLELFGLPTQVVTTNIYTRWGKLIYTSDIPSPGWDGLINGDLANEGAYLYEVIFEDSDGVKVIQKGTFALIKK